MRPASNLQRWRTLCLWGCAALALTSLPPDRFDAVWLATFVAPSLVLHALVAGTRLRSWICLLAALTTFVAMLAVAAWAAPPLTRVTALGCTLIPPLAFLAARRGRSDVLRALFLAFCVFLVGAILGKPSGAQTMTFLGLAIATLYLDSAVIRWWTRHAWRGADARPWSHVKSVAVSIAGAALVCLTVFQLLRVVPAPSTDPEPDRRAAASQHRSIGRVGLSSTFDLDSLGGGILDLRAEEIVRVHSLDRSAPPRDLYLRFTHFDVAGIDRWRTRRGRVRRVDAAAGSVRRPVPRVPLREILIELVEPSDNHVLAPPGTVWIRGLSGLLGDPRRSLYRLAERPAPGTRYSVGFQDLRGLVENELTDPALEGLTALSRDLQAHTPHFVEILRTAEVEKEIDPVKMARAIAAVLADRCDYSLRGPNGPHRHALLNFLNGDRRGFCMHYATVTAICLRLAGVPCRIGVGLHGGSPMEGAPGVLALGSADAHAWVEIPFERRGWVVFDPTPPAERAAAQRLWPSFDAEGIAGGDTDGDDGGATDDGLGSAIAVFGDPLRHPVLWALLAIVLLTSVYRRKRDPGPAAVRRDTPESRSARRQLEKLLSRLGELGWRRQRGTSLESYAGQLAQFEELPRESIRAAFDAYQEVRFGGRPFDSERRARLDCALVAVRPLRPRRVSDGP